MSKRRSTVGSPTEDSLRTTVRDARGGDAWHNAEFVFGMEVRVDAAYRVTRDLSLRFGFEFLDFGKGIGRGIDPQRHEPGRDHVRGLNGCHLESVTAVHPQAHQ